MKPCDEHSASVLLYLDGELSGHELEDFLTHLRDCPDCTVMLAEERSLSQMLRRARPLHPAPESLRASVTEIIQPKAGFYPQASNSLRKRIVRIMRRPMGSDASPVRRWQALAAMILVMALALVSVPLFVQQARANSFVDAAIVTHRGYMNGDLPLEIRSDSPAAVTAWFAGKVPFHFQLPNSDPARYGKADYRLTGGRLVAFRGGYAALVTYEMQAEKISLMVTSSQSATASGGGKIRVENITFHYRSDGGFKVITWSNHELTYALVSSLPGSARQSCLVCHQNMTDRDVFAKQP